MRGYKMHVDEGMCVRARERVHRCQSVSQSLCLFLWARFNLHELESARICKSI
jgi:hypothetical protein